MNSVVPVNLNQKFSVFSEHWRPKVVAELNGQEVKLVKFKGEFVWHHHDEQDELFLVWKGKLRVEVVIFEPAETRNTGNIADDKFTAPDGVAI